MNWILVRVDFVSVSNSPDNNRTQFSLLLLPTSHINSIPCFPLVCKDPSVVMSPLAFVEACSHYVSQPGLSHDPPSALQELEFQMHDTSLTRHAWMVHSLACLCAKFFIHHSCLHWFPSFWRTSFICAVNVVNVRLCVSHKSSPSFILLWHIVLEWQFPICTWKMSFRLSPPCLAADLKSIVV